jgi:membrane-associated phospholipid phosphatase
VRCRLATAVCVCCLAAPVLSGAQTIDAQPAPPALPAPAAGSFWEPFKALGGDFSRFVSGENLRILAPAVVGAAAVHRLDDHGIDMAMSRLQPTSGFTAGNIGGGFYAQTGGAFITYALGRALNSETVASVGADLVRAQIVTQGTVQAVKLAARRWRPDGSDRYSLPSGHAAGTFATATVLQRHFGWKVGLPAYAAGVYVATSRMSANKHHLSDVMLGAAFGIVAGRSVTMGSGRTRFDMSVGPTVGGGAVTFTRK